MNEQNPVENTNENSIPMEQIDSVAQPQPEESITSNELPKTSNKKKGNKKVTTILIIVLALALLGGLVFFVTEKLKDKNKPATTEAKEYKSEYRMSGNSLEDFDLYFLKLENGKENKIYSPLSIKYALEMLAEGSDGDTKAQLDSVIGDYEAKSYINSANMSFANAFFVNELYKDYMQKDYINKLKNIYGAEVVFDPFTTPDTINTWVKDKTLNLIDGILTSLNPEIRFVLINALGIDMEWEQKFILYPGRGVYVNYSHEKFHWSGAKDVKSFKFNNEEQTVKGMDVIASFNNYDIVKELGEENIRKTVGEAYRKYLQEMNESQTEEEINQYLDEYIKEINSNYKKEEKTTDFSLYVDDDVKVFAKDLKEYNGTTLQYVGIMPKKQDLDAFVNSTNPKSINTLIGNLKTLKRENFKDGVVTKITGYIPKFKFEYDLNLMEDLKTLGITDVFDYKKANLSKLTSEPENFIQDVKHKANIEFTEDGIKAAATTIIEGGLGSAGFNYLYDVPVEEIDISFDKPYMFIIRDKNSGEVWFTGTVYNPLEG